MRTLMDEYNIKKLNVTAEVKKELEAQTGFLEELNALIRIMSENKIALVFYALLFFFLIFLELLVFMSKFGDRPCDYDLIIQHQLAVKKDALEDLVKKT